MTELSKLAITTVDQQVSVSGQITPDDVAVLVEQGVEVLVCNRPDNESSDQPSYSIIAAAAAKHGVHMVNIPFAGGQMQAEHTQAFADIVASGKRIHAYCRTGNRSSTLYTAVNSIKK